MSHSDTPDPRPLSPAARLQRAIGVLLVIELVAIALFAYGFYRWTFEWRLNGPRIPAQVTGVEQRGDTFYVTYVYKVNDHEFAREHRVSQWYFEGVTPGQSIEIVYSPADAAISGIPGQGRGDFDLNHLPGVFFDLRFLIFVLPIVIAVLLLMIAGLWVALRRHARAGSGTE